MAGRSPIRGEERASRRRGGGGATRPISDPPYYTACPNPWLADFVKHYSKPYDPEAKYSREPLAIDVSVGKTDALYKAHSYHTKVPHLAIVPSILHYTQPGDVVLDAGEAERRALEYLAALHRSGSVEVDGDVVRVHLSFEHGLVLLDAFGVGPMTIEGDGEARAVRGVTEAST